MPEIQDTQPQSEKYNPWTQGGPVHPVPSLAPAMGTIFKWRSQFVGPCPNALVTGELLCPVDSIGPLDPPWPWLVLEGEAETLSCRRETRRLRLGWAGPQV